MITGIFDSHTHYDDERFSADTDKTLERIHQNGVQNVLNSAGDLESCLTSVALAEKYDWIYAAVGVHPHDAADVPAQYIKHLEDLALNCPKVRAIGEIGLDYFYDGAYKLTQQKVFGEQLELAGRLGLPVIIHDREAHADTMECLCKYRPSGVVHCFSGSAEMARQVVKLGMYVGFTGVITFKNSRRAAEAARQVPLDRLLVETDCPYMAPEPYRGKRCDSSMLDKTIEALAAIKGLSPQELADITNENARRLFHIEG